jgi:RNA-directed DNA polymerase
MNNTDATDADAIGRMCRTRESHSRDSSQLFSLAGGQSRMTAHPEVDIGVASSEFCRYGNQPGWWERGQIGPAHAAIRRVSTAILEGKTYVIDFDLRSYFDTVRHHILLEKVARRVDDEAVLWLLKLLLEASGKQGVPQGGIISPLLSNLYLNEADKMLERAKAVTLYERWTAVEYARFADDLVILVDSHPRQQWLRQAVEKRLREELAKLQVEVNEDNSRKVDLQRGESFGFLGFEFRRIRSRRGRWMPLLLPKGKKRTALLDKLREIFRVSRSQPVGGVIEKINPILRGWVKYFAIGHSSRCFSYIRDWVEKKIRRHLARACQRRGFGWKRWSREWMYGTLGLFSEYRVSYGQPISAVAPV